MSLHSADDTEPEQNEIKDLREQLAETTSLVKTLSQQLGDLRDKVAFHCIHVNVLQQKRGGGGIGISPLQNFGLTSNNSCSIVLSQMIEQRKLYQRKTLQPRVGQGQYPNNMMTL